jgi:hypothetical protein
LDFSYRVFGRSISDNKATGARFQTGLLDKLALTHPSPWTDRQGSRYLSRSVANVKIFALVVVYVSLVADRH